MKPMLHALISVKKFGGIPEDYIDIHNWFDSTKAHIADERHRKVLHNAFGIFLCEQVFGTITQMPSGEFKRMPYILNSDGKKISVRDIAEQHVVDDMGRIPSLEECVGESPIEEKFVGNAHRVLRLPKGSVRIVD